MNEGKQGINDKTIQKIIQKAPGLPSEARETGLEGNGETRPREPALAKLSEELRMSGERGSGGGGRSGFLGEAATDTALFLVDCCLEEGVADAERPRGETTSILVLCLLLLLSVLRSCDGRDSSAAVLAKGSSALPVVRCLPLLGGRLARSSSLTEVVSVGFPAPLLLSDCDRRLTGGSSATDGTGLAGSGCLSIERNRTCLNDGCGDAVLFLTRMLGDAARDTDGVGT